MFMIKIKKVNVSKPTTSQMGWLTVLSYFNVTQRSSNSGLLETCVTLASVKLTLNFVLFLPFAKFLGWNMLIRYWKVQPASKRILTCHTVDKTVSEFHV